MRYSRILILILVLALLMAATSCRNAVETPEDQDPDPNGDNGETPEEPTDPEPEPEPEPDPGPPETTTLGEISLGDPVDEVLLRFGSMYEETVIDDEAGYFGEPINYWNYQDRIGFMVGVTTQQVLRIDVFDSGYYSNLGAYIGQKASEILPVYREYYEELVSIHTEAVVPGWFLVEDDKLLILRFSDGSEASFGDPIPDDALLVEMSLAYLEHFD